MDIMNKYNDDKHLYFTPLDEAQIYRILLIS